MKNCIFSAFFLLLLATPILSAEQQSQNPTLVFFVDHEDQPEKDFVQITLEIEAKDTSLTNAINSGASTVQQISNLAKDFCSENAKKKNQCKQIVDAGKFEVQPRYQLIRKQPVFMGFTVTHEMTIAVTSVENIGYLVDKILTKSGITLQNFEWKALQDPKTHEQAIAEGMEQGQGLCEQLGLKLGRIISIEEVNESDAEAQAPAEQEQGEQGQEEEQQEQSSTVFRFEVECAEKPKDKKQQSK